MLTKLQIAKHTHFFNVIDFNKNGLIQKNDFDAIAENLALTRDFDYDSPEFIQVQSAWGNIWDNFSKSIGQAGTTLETWLKFMDLVVHAEKEVYLKYIHLITKSMFGVIDSNHNGVISVSEYVDLLMGFRVDITAAHKSFDKLDRDKDGFISKQELMQAVHDFIRSDKSNAAGNWLFGDWE